MGNLPRLFRLMRDTDVSDVSGTGHVADIVVFTDGEAAIHWYGDYPTTTPHPKGLKSLNAIHGHNGLTRIEPADLDEHDKRWAFDMVGILSDLDRCKHGRHHGDACGDCGIRSLGNPHITPGMTIGYDRLGNPIVMPSREDKHKEEAWRKK